MVVDTTSKPFLETERSTLSVASRVAEGTDETNLVPVEVVDACALVPAELIESAKTDSSKSKSEATLKINDKDWRRFLAWCDQPCPLGSTSYRQRGGRDPSVL